MNMTVVATLESLKRYVKHYVSNIIPGYITILNVFVKKRSGKDLIDLLFDSPSQLYALLKEYYSLCEESADTAMRLFLRAIAIALNAVGIEDELLKLAKSGKDDEFLKIINSYIRKAEKSSRIHT